MQLGQRHAADRALKLMIIGTLVAGVGEVAEVEVEGGAGERLGVGEVVLARKQVGVVPDGVSSVDTTVLCQRRPQGGRLAQSTWTQLQADQRGERLLGGTAGRAAAAEHF